MHVGAGLSTGAHTKEGAQKQNVRESGHEIVLLLTEGLDLDRDQQEKQEHQQRHEEAYGRVACVVKPSGIWLLLRPQRASLSKRKGLIERG